MSIDRVRVKEIRKNLERVLAQFGQENKVLISVGPLHWDSREIRGKMTMIDRDSVTAEPSVIAELPKNTSYPDFSKYAHKYGLRPEDQGRSFLLNGRCMTVVDIKPRNHKFPIIVLGPEGGRYKLDAATVLRNLQILDLTSRNT